MYVVKAEQSDSELHLSEDEVLAQVGIDVAEKSTSFTGSNCIQMKVLILAGYETTSSKFTISVSLYTILTHQYSQLDGNSLRVSLHPRLIPNISGASLSCASSRRLNKSCAKSFCSSMAVIQHGIS